MVVLILSYHYVIRIVFLHRPDHEIQKKPHKPQNNLLASLRRSLCLRQMWKQNKQKKKKKKNNNKKQQQQNNTKI